MSAVCRPVKTPRAGAFAPVALIFIALTFAGITGGTAHAQTTNVQHVCWYNAWPTSNSMTCYDDPEQVCETWKPLYGNSSRVWKFVRTLSGQVTAICRGDYYGNRTTFYSWPLNVRCVDSTRKAAAVGCVIDLQTVEEPNCSDKSKPPIRTPPDLQTFSAANIANSPLPVIFARDNVTKPFPTEGNPVYLASGDKLARAVDFRTSGQKAFRFERAYSHLSGQPGQSFGFGWSSLMDRYIRNPTSYSPVVVLEGGQAYGFSGNGPYTPAAAGRRDTLVKTSSSTWIWTSPEGQQTEFSAVASTVAPDEALADKVTERNGYAVTIARDAAGLATALTDSFGRAAAITWSGDAISHIAFPGGYAVDYTYATVASGTAGASTGGLRLQSATLSRASDPDTRTTAYLYEDTRYPFALTGITDARGVRYATYSYDVEAHVADTQHAGGVDDVSVSYTSSGNLRTVTNPLGRQDVFHFDPRGGRLMLTSITGQASTHVPASSSSLGYNASAFVTSRVDEEARTDTFVPNAAGRETSRTEGSGSPVARTIATTWDTTRPLPLSIAEPGLTRTMSYDTAGNMTSITLTDTTSFTTPYATNGRARTWAFSYTAAGLLASVDGPLSGSGDTTSYTYDGTGYLATVTNPLGQTTQITSVNGLGLPLTVVDANSVTTAFTYDVTGRILTATRNPGAQQSLYAFQYDAAGDLTKLTLPGGGWLQATYDDARRVTSIANDQGEEEDYSSNANRDVTSAQIKTTAGAIVRQQTFAYDELGRLLQSIGAGSQTWSFAYDKVGNPTAVTDARGNTFQYAYDALNRLIIATDPESHSVHYAYTPQNAPATLTDGRGLATTRIVDGFGQVILEISPDRGTRTYWYDEAGQLTRQIDGDGNEIDFAYDTAGRLTAETLPAVPGENAAYSYDTITNGNKGAGRLTGVTDATGSTALTYDEQGRVTAEARILGGRTYNLAFAYDANGLPVQVTFPSGRIVSTARDGSGRITGVSTQASAASIAETVADSATYLPFGPLSGWTYGNGLQLTRSFDASYQLSRVQVTDGAATPLDLSFGRNANGQVEAVTDNASTGRSGTAGYSTSGRLTAATGPFGQLGFSYDAAGNRSQLSSLLSGVTSLRISTIGATDNRITELRDGAGSLLRALTYQTGGAVSQDQETGGPLYAYTYNAHGRLAAVQKNGVTVGSYGYDAFGRRVSRQTFGTGAVNESYIFDDAGHLLAEHDAATGAVIREYVWLDEVPVAVIDSSTGLPATYFIHAGQLNEPLAMTNASKAQVWNASSEPFGAAQVFAGSSAALDLRLPGQWRQAETGLHQNGFRDYDPTLGRYLEADPLGVSAGQNVYAYADGDSLDRVDPTGLASAGFTLDGFGVTAGWTKTRHRPFLTLQAGLGVGFGVSMDPDGGPDDCQGEALPVSVAYFAKASVGVGPSNVSLKGTLGNNGVKVEPSLPLSPLKATKIELGMSASAGVQTTFVW